MTKTSKGRCEPALYKCKCSLLKHSPPPRPGNLSKAKVTDFVRAKLKDLTY